MKAAIHQQYFDIKTGESCQWTFFQADFETFLNGWPEFARHVTASDLGFELKTRTHFCRLDNIIDLSKLT